MATESPHWFIMGKMVSPPFLGCFDPILFILAGDEDMHKILDEFEFRPDRTTYYGVSCPWGLKFSHRLLMGKWYLHASSFIFDRIIIKVASNQDRHKSSDELDFGPLVSNGPFICFLKWEDVKFGLWRIKRSVFSIPVWLAKSDLAAHNSPRPFGFISFK